MIPSMSFQLGISELRLKVDCSLRMSIGVAD